MHLGRAFSAWIPCLSAGAGTATTRGFVRKLMGSIRFARAVSTSGSDPVTPFATGCDGRR